VRRDQQHRSVAVVQVRQGRVAVIQLAGRRPEQGVDDRVAGDHDGGRVHVLGEQVGLARRRRSQVQGGQLGGQAAVDLLRVRRIRVVGAQARLQVHDGDLLVEGGERGGEHGGGVTLHDHGVRSLPGK